MPQLFLVSSPLSYPASFGTINDNLEAMAKQLYDYWFAQFDFPNEEGKPYKSSGGAMIYDERLKKEIPIGWGCDKLNKWLEIKSGFAFKSETYKLQGKYKIVTIKNVQDHHLDTSNCDYVDEIPRGMKEWCYLSINDRLISLTGNCGRLCVVTEDNLLLNQRVGLLACNSEKLDYAYLLLSSNEYQTLSNNLAKGAAQANLSPVDLCKNMAVIPPINILDNFNKRISPLIVSYIQNEAQISNLTKQRDELLPLLMNGQASINYHLSASPEIFIIIVPKTMKEKLIASILEQARAIFDTVQCENIKELLINNLDGLDITLAATSEESVRKANTELLSAFISAKKIEGSSAKTLAYYENTIVKMFCTTKKPVAEITTNDIRNYLAEYQEERHLSKVTVDNIRRIFSSFFSWLEDEDLILKSPVRRIHKVRTDTLVKETITDEQLEQLRDSCTEIRDLALIDLLASTGMRVGELVRMNRNDLNFHERQCIVFGKGNKEREVYFNARTKIHLQQYLDSRTDTNPALFVSLSKPYNRLTISGVEVRLRTIGNSIGLNRIHPHKFRRTLATMAIDKGMPIEQVQCILGHVKIDTTLHYAKVNQLNVKMSHRKYIG